MLQISSLIGTLLYFIRHNGVPSRSENNLSRSGRAPYITQVPVTQVIDGQSEEGMGNLIIMLYTAGLKSLKW